MEGQVLAVTVLNSHFIYVGRVHDFNGKLKQRINNISCWACGPHRICVVALISQAFVAGLNSDGEIATRGGWLHVHDVALTAFFEDDGVNRGDEGVGSTTAIMIDGKSEATCLRLAELVTSGGIVRRALLRYDVLVIAFYFTKTSREKGCSWCNEVPKVFDASGEGIGV